MLVVVIDQILGVSFRYAGNHLKDGEKKWEHYISYQSKADIAVFGSSRACHHYSTSVLHDSLGGKVINYGKDGMGIIYSYAMMKSLTNRHTPKIIILDVITQFDLEENDNVKYIAPLRYMNDIPSFNEVINDVTPLESQKLLCQSYKYNTEWFYLCRDAIKGQSFDYKINGFWPLSERKKLGKGDVCADHVSVDSVKLRYLKSFIKEASSKSKLYVFVSPWYHGASAKAYNAIEKICKEENVYFNNMFCDNIFSKDSSYWSDNCHLNFKGADIYTKKVAHIIRDETNKTETNITIL